MFRDIISLCGSFGHTNKKKVRKKTRFTMVSMILIIVTSEYTCFLAHKIDSYGCKRLLMDVDGSIGPVKWIFHIHYHRILPTKF